MMGRVGPEPGSELQAQTFEISDVQVRHGLRIKAQLLVGSGGVRVLDPDGAVVHQHLWDTLHSEQFTALGPWDRTGPYTLEVSMEDAVGRWQLHLVELPAKPSVGMTWASGPLALLFAAGITVLTVATMKLSAKWVLLGLVLFLPYFILRYVGYLAFYMTLRPVFASSMTHTGFVVMESVFTGLSAGIALVVISLVYASAFSKWLGRREVTGAIALGASLCYPLYIGSAHTGMARWMGSDAEAATKALFEQAYVSAMTPVDWLVEPIRAMIVLVIFATAFYMTVCGWKRRAWGMVAGGFVLLVCQEAVLSLTRIMDLWGYESRWWAVAAVLALSLLAIVAGRVAWQSTAQLPESDEVPVRQEDVDA
jgi:hypothetical protein